MYSLICTAQDEIAPATGLLDWETVHHKMSWGVVILLGGGFALAESCKVHHAG